MNATESASLKILADASGAFFGALFAFIFGLVTYYWTKWLERQNKDYSAIVKLEGILNEHLNTTSRNRYLIRGSIKTLEAGGVTYNILRKYRLVEDLELSFLDLDLINKYFEYRDSTEVFNHDFEVANKACDILREVVLSGKADPTTIKFNVKIMIQNLEVVSKMILATNEEAKSLLCLIRIKIQKDEPGLIGIKRLHWQPYKPTNRETKAEMSKLEKEITETKEASSKKISEGLSIIQ